MIRDQHLSLSAAIGLAALGAIAGGCVVSPPGWCDTDEECRSRDLVRPFCSWGFRQCVGVKDGVYCASDADCRNPARSRYDPARPSCHATLSVCVAADQPHEAGVDGREAGADLAPPPDVGIFCQKNPAGTTCGDDSCAGGALVTYACANGTCAAGTPQPCGGGAYSCLDKTRCRTECVAPGDCSKGWHCEAKACVADLDLGKACKLGGECKSGLCTDGVCCTQADCGTCKRCAAADGKCTPLAPGPAPAGQCAVGDAECGAGTCDGAGGCGWADKSCSVKTACPASGSTLTTFACNPTTHKCESASSTCSGFHMCATSGKACSTSCAGHADCVASSVCDRSNAHVTAAGSCIDPGKVAVLAAGQKLQDAVNALGSKTHIRTAPSASYLEALDVTGKAVTIIGDGAASIINAAGPAVFVGNGATATLQGLQLKQSSIGVQCLVSVTSTLTIVESTVVSNTGIGITATNCSVSLYRNTIASNANGGVMLTTGTFKLADNLIRNNGTAGSSSLGGVQLSSGTVTFTNNTVVLNSAQTGTIAGVLCSSATQVLKNSILDSNTGSAQYLGCTLDHTNDANGCALSAAYKPTAAPCINAGVNTGVSALDLASTARIKGGTVDLGAYEVQ